MTTTSQLPAGAPPWTVLPIPPNEYDPVYMQSLVRFINFFMQQVTTPGNLSGASMTIYTNRPKYTNTRDPDLLFNTQDNQITNTLIIASLPTSATGLQPNQVWADPATGLLHITPALAGEGKS